MKSKTFFSICLLAIILLLLVVPPVHAASPIREDPGSVQSFSHILSEVLLLSVVVFAATAWLKQLGARGQTLTIAAFVFGVIFGMTYRYAMAPFTTFTDWFWAATLGLMSGFLATGAYKGAESATKQRIDAVEFTSTLPSYGQTYEG